MFGDLVLPITFATTPQLLWALRKLRYDADQYILLYVSILLR